MTTFNDLIKKCDFNEVLKSLEKYYDMTETRSIKFKNFYNKLLLMEKEENQENMYIYISVFKSDENNNSIYQESFDDNDDSLYYDVSGKDDTNSVYSLVASKFESWLGFYIDDNNLKNISIPNIIAHCLWEMTFLGYDRKFDEKGT